MNAITIATPGSTKWLRRAGKIGFWFFFIKGTLWVAAPLVFYWFI
jgi:hypothetical protein